LSALLLSACIFDVMRDQQIVGRYYLVAIDLSENTKVCFPPDDAFCVGEGLPGPAVFAAGGDDRYVVAARHPNVRSGTIDRTVTEYYYVIREPNDRRQGQVVGPLDEAEFRAEAQRLELPDFSITIDRLR
jgi:hypothetical protein